MQMNSIAQQTLSPIPNRMSHLALLTLGGAGSLDTKELLARGYLVVALNYQLAPQSKFPA